MTAQGMLKQAVRSVLVPYFETSGFNVKDFVGDRASFKRRDCPLGNLVRPDGEGGFHMLDFQFGAQGSARFTVNFARIPPEGLEGLPPVACDSEMAVIRCRVYRGRNPMKWFRLPWYRQKTEVNYKGYVESLTPYMQEVLDYLDKGKEGPNVLCYRP